MKTILILSNDFATIHYFRRELIKELVLNNFIVVVSLPPSKDNLDLFSLGCKIDEIRLERWSKNLKKESLVFFEYLKQLKRVLPDVVLSFTVKPNIFGSLACQLKKTPYINNVTGFGNLLQKESFLKKVILFLYKIAFRKSNCVFFQNAFNLNFFVDKKIVEKSYKLIPGSGVNLKINRCLNYPKDDGTLNLLFLSRISKDKGFDAIVETIQYFGKNGKNVQFHIVGPIEDDRYSEKINELKCKFKVLFYGKLSREKVSDIFLKSHCLIHPSHHEGMSNAILEAAACGRPCIVSDIPGCREAVEDGVSGYTFKVKDATSLIEKIEKFIQLPYEEKKAMGLAGRKKMEREFDRNIVVNAYMEEIERIISQKKGNPS